MLAVDLSQTARLIMLAVVVVAFAASFTQPASAQRGLTITAKQLQEMRTEKRVALVIGNSNYSTSRLRNPVNDAKAMSIKLRSLGFDVTERLDVDQRNMRRAMIDFGKKLTKGGVGLFYFAGHGVQFEGQNYLIPVGAEIDEEDHVAVEGVSVNQVLSRMGTARNRLNLVILDSCRNNPYAGTFRSPTRGLAVTRSPKGTYISYAAAPGAVAADGRGKHSPYTQAILDNMDAPGVRIEEVFKRVRTSVLRATGNKQLPYTESSLTGDFYFKVPVGSAPQLLPLPPTVSNEDKLWNDIKDSKQGDEYAVFLKQYPNSVRAPLARARMKRLGRQQTAGITPVPRVKSTAPGPAKPAVGVFPQQYKPGDVFRDCSDCPEMVVIPAGSFMMGSPASEPGRASGEGPQHQVVIRQHFAVGRYEVAQMEWRSVMGTNPSSFKGDRKPVEGVSWNDAQTFVKKLSAKTGKRYRLLSEAEWEYAARAGTTTPFHTGNQIYTGQANFSEALPNGSSKGQFGKGTVAVGSFPANVFGLHDMHGNVWEWVGDCWNKAYHGAPTDGGTWSAGDCSRRVLRGGSWYDYPWIVRAAIRSRYPPGLRHRYNGFRIARTLF